MRKWISCLTVAVVSLGAITGAAAADNPPSRTVKAWDLDLANAADVSTLYARVRTAADDICRAEAQSSYRNTRFRAPLQWRARCVQDAVDDAIRSSANPALAALHTQAPRVASRF